jgi:ArsR family transcriptional regulator
MIHKDDFYKAFANENRVKLIMCLSKPKCVTDLLSLCTLSQSALSQHLKVLKDAGIAVCEREGKQQIYAVKNKKVIKIAELLLELDK